MSRVTVLVEDVVVVVVVVAAFAVMVVMVVTMMMRFDKGWTMIVSQRYYQY
jgi:hypothetical protein